MTIATSLYGYNQMKGQDLTTTDASGNISTILGVSVGVVIAIIVIDILILIAFITMIISCWKNKCISGLTAAIIIIIYFLLPAVIPGLNFLILIVVLVFWITTCRKGCGWKEIKLSNY